MLCRERRFVANPSDRDVYLFGIAGPSFGRKCRVNRGEPTLIGRGAARRNPDNQAGSFQPNHVFMEDDSVHNRQARIDDLDGLFRLTFEAEPDARGKTTPVYVNRQRLARKDDHVDMRPGDEIVIGRSTFRFVAGENLEIRLPRTSGPVWTGLGHWLLFAATVLIVALLIPLVVVPALRYHDLAAARPGVLELRPGASGQSGADPVVELTVNYNYAPALVWLPGLGCCGIVAPDSSGRPVVFDGRSLNRLWAADERIATDQGLVVADLTGAGTDDILFATAGSRVVAANPRKHVWLWKSDLLDAALLTPTAADLDGNGTNDVVCLSQDGLVFIGWNKPPNVRFVRAQRLAGEFYAPPTITDFDGDSKPEIVVVNAVGRVTVMDGVSGTIKAGEFYPDAEIRRQTGIASDQQVLTSPAAAAPSGGRNHNLVVACRDANAALVLSLDWSMQEPRLRWAKNLFAVLPKPNSITPAHYPSPVMADLNGDGEPDVILGTQAGHLVALNGASGDTLWSYYDPERWDMVLATPALYDFNKDGTPDIVMADNRGEVHIVTGRTGNRLAMVQAVPGQIVGSPLVGDVDGDFMVDIVVEDADGHLRILATNSATPERRAFWPMAGGTSGREGVERFRGFDPQTRMLSVYAMLGLVLILVGANVMVNAARCRRLDRLERLCRESAAN
ncbi:MAG: FG-GAP-like repeat-containing protein [candidate division WOR-3 bacterium]|nr:FG-GAP-like repeat-containing protein [candidate division WOR-3 bacterium]